MSDKSTIDQFADANNEIKQAEEKVQRLVDRFHEIAGSLTTWRSSGMHKKEPGKLNNPQPAFPKNGEMQGYTIDVNQHVPTLDEVFEARQQWVDAIARQQDIVDQMSDNELKLVRGSHPEIRKSNTVRFGD